MDTCIRIPGIETATMSIESKDGIICRIHSLNIPKSWNISYHSELPSVEENPGIILYDISNNKYTHIHIPHELELIDILDASASKMVGIYDLNQRLIFLNNLINADTIQFRIDEHQRRHWFGNNNNYIHKPLGNASSAIAVDISDTSGVTIEIINNVKEAAKNGILLLNNYLSDADSDSSSLPRFHSDKNNYRMYIRINACIKTTAIGTSNSNTHPIANCYDIRLHDGKYEIRAENIPDMNKLGLKYEDCTNILNRTGLNVSYN